MVAFLFAFGGSVVGGCDVVGSVVGGCDVVGSVVISFFDVNKSFRINGE